MILWGFAVHKAQGKTLDNVVVDLESEKFFGMTLVALFHVLEPNPIVWGGY